LVQALFHQIGRLIVEVDFLKKRLAVLSWRLSRTLETTFCFEAAEEVVKDFGAPIIINEDQGSQNTD
jgi:putative transposase